MSPLEGCSYTAKRKHMGEESYNTHQELWERYREIERRELEQRRNGQLSRALGWALPGEPQDELERIAEDYRRRAEEGLVELRSADAVGPDRIGGRQGGLDPGTPAPSAPPAVRYRG